MSDTKIRSIRVPEPIWRKARAKARREGTDISTVVRQFLMAYVEYHGQEKTG